MAHEYRARRQVGRAAILATGQLGAPTREPNGKPQRTAARPASSGSLRLLLLLRPPPLLPDSPANNLIELARATSGRWRAHCCCCSAPQLAAEKLNSLLSAEAEKLAPRAKSRDGCARGPPTCEAPVAWPPARGLVHANAPKVAPQGLRAGRDFHLIGVAGPPLAAWPVRPRSGPAIDQFNQF